MKKLAILPILALLLALTSFLTASAQSKYNERYIAAGVSLPAELHPEYAPVISLQNGNIADYGNYFLQLIAGGLIYIAAPMAVLIIAIGGVRYIASHGEQTQMEGAKKTITWAIIGLVIIIFSYAIIEAIITSAINVNQPAATTTTPSPGTPGGATP